MEPNAELAYRVLDQIDAHPELWDQGWFFTMTDCGTTACFAGWTCLLSGEMPDYERQGFIGLDGDEAYWLASGERADVRALELLGLTNGFRLFASGNTRADLQLCVEELFGPRPDSMPERTA
jgi:hypothetical protein